MIRLLRNVVREPPWWPNLPRYWTAEVDEEARLFGTLAGVLEPVPGGLVRWSRFDEAAFQAAVKQAEEPLPEERRERFASWFAQSFPLWAAISLRYAADPRLRREIRAGNAVAPLWAQPGNTALYFGPVPPAALCHS